VTDEPTDPQPGPSGIVIAAGVILLVIGSLVAIVASLGFLAWALLGEMVNPSVQAGYSEEQRLTGLATGQTFFTMASVGVIVAFAHLLAGIGVLRRRGWARIVGIMLGSLGAGLWAFVLLSTIVGVIPPVPPHNSTLTPDEYRAVVRVGLVFVRAFAVVGLAASIFGMEVLARRGREFA
jgi:magnesium-transporting ATPase (P-type)